MKSSIETSIELDVPARTAYDQLTQFEEYPRILPVVQDLVQLDERRFRWHARVGGKLREFVTEICEQIPDKRIAWRSVSGPWNAGVVTIHRISDDRSKLMLQVDYEAEGLVAKMTDLIGYPKRRLDDGLEKVRHFLEARGTATGAWRGAIPSPDDDAGGATTTSTAGSLRRGT
jgi:uncharacterized membrane protein